LSCLDNLFYLTRSGHLSSFHTFFLSSIDEIKSLRSRINLRDEQSICDGKHVILLIKNQLTAIVSKLDNRSENNLNQQLNIICNKALIAIRFLATRLHRYQMEICEKKSTRPK
jgi:hypothetical protein